MIKKQKFLYSLKLCDVAKNPFLTRQDELMVMLPASYQYYYIIYCLLAYICKALRNLYKNWLYTYYYQYKKKAISNYYKINNPPRSNLRWELNLNLCSLAVMFTYRICNREWWGWQISTNGQYCSGTYVYTWLGLSRTWFFLLFFFFLNYPCFIQIDKNF